MTDRASTSARQRPLRRGLYDPAAGHSSCGVGALVDLRGRPSHDLVVDGVRLLENLDHRGARGAEEKTGDGAGMLLQKPHAFFAEEVAGLPEFDGYGVGQIFFPADADERRAVIDTVERTVREEGLEILAWRQVPTDGSTLGATARASQPVVRQLFVAADEPLAPRRLDTRLFVLRRRLEKAVSALELADPESFYICSLDRRKIVYKGMLTCSQLPEFFPDLRDERMRSALVLVHSRFSTNTLGAWHLAHPYRSIVHNGEFNTLRGNLNWMWTREATLASDRFGADIDKLKPINAGEDLSDSASFDHVLELLVESGRSLPHALRMLIPEAWNKDTAFMDADRRAFYEYSSTLMEPWDGPALVAASDGYSVGAILDRNGLRPARYCVTRDDRLIMASETGVLDTPAEDIVYKGRLKPGQMFLADTQQGRIVPEDEIFSALTSRPYGEWLADNRVRIDDVVAASEPASTDEGVHDDPRSVTAAQRCFGYTMEALRYLVTPMAENAKDPIGAMGTDTPPAVLSGRSKPLAGYFLQEFAQVSNPALDYIREDLVTSLESYIGHQRNLLEETPEHCRQLFLRSPILSDAEMTAIRSIDRGGIRARTIDLTYPLGTALRDAIEQIRAEAAEAIREGYEILVLSDRDAGPERVPIPSLLAVGGLHHHLVREGLRTRAGLVLDSGQPAQVHHFCTLLGHGVDAIHPWLAYRSIAQYLERGWLEAGDEDPYVSYRRAVEGGLMKVMSKMGISTLESYKGAQIFEAVGLDREVVDEFFTGTNTRIPGVGLDQIEAETLEAHREAYGPEIPGNLPLDPGGELYWRRDGELHQWNPITIGALQHAVRTGDDRAYRQFADAVNEQDEKLQTLRGLMEPVAGEPVPIEEVEPCEEIMKRFSSGSMSFGALSREAHEAITAGVNRVGGKTGTGEGGEQIDRFGTERECSMKQVASGRFGVTHQYLAQASQIEIKVAQGSKPGEGGELPGGKVGDEIAEVRFTVPGVGLISPPPHHDIYSIEDLAQLIHDLKCANPDAEVHVKLVAKANVGTIAAGVAKGRADAVLISGDSGGTGASVKTSIKHAGAPWELGLSETHQVLMANNLRSRIRVRTDGGLKTGRDVVIAALLGAEEFGFGTAPMVTVGCIMLRKCHCNTCSVGVATQNPVLREQFPGAPEHVVRYMQYMAQEARALMAELGFRSMDEMIGRADRLRQKPVSHPKGITPDLSDLLYVQPSDDTPRKVMEQNHFLDRKIDNRFIDQAEPALKRGEPVEIEAEITNRDRTLGTLLSSAVAKRYGGEGLPADTIVCRLTGTGGQSFGAFLAPGISLHLTGDVNDYPGKGLSGGRISVGVPHGTRFDPARNTIAGNVALYGATRGEAYFNGLAGERFAVRNSGAMAVVEGIGDHGCEYMTGGVVVCLGGIGKNFGAGMSGGEAYILQEDDDFEARLNPELVHTEPFTEERDQHLVRRLIENHYAYTGSPKARAILDDWQDAAKRIVKVIPSAYQEVVQRYMDEGQDIRLAPPEPANDSQVA